MEIKIRVLSGECERPEYIFDEPGGFIFGRAEDCTCRMPASDMTFSRHHFLLEIIPPNVMLKDLGSLNGTHVNGIKYGGRSSDVRPEDADISQALPLRDGDKIEAGKCILEVAINSPAICVDCACEIPAEERMAAQFVGGTYLCKDCRNKEEKKRQEKERRVAAVKPPAPDEIKMDVEQRMKAENNPAAVINELMQALLGANDKDKPPAIRGYYDLKKVGEGGFGAVYLAIRASDKQKVAVKTMLQTRKPKSRQLLMFEREMEIAKQLQHPNIVHCIKASVWNDIHFLEMEYMDGGDVYSLMKQKGGKLSLSEAVPIMLDALEGLAYAHTATITVTLKTGTKAVNGVIHRDLKPPNILLSGASDRWTAKLSDFGLAKAFSEAGLTKGSVTADVGAFCGTIPYVAPEHLVRYRNLKPATDVFEMAATFYHMLTGEVVWPIRRGVDPIKAVLEGTITPIRQVNSDIPKSLAKVFDKALQRSEYDRYDNAGAMLKAMKKAL